ncbi:hypothetical protein B0F90DRAFT_1779187 [Multifurca ochricompacta]|uniref:Uncharacterized protein n=1 Tax=Multifurca ochricompacta TaxID=376703 RepID=A0AAD4QJ39_9AGAM|nr:hypothetical protein B0F90DRAFT_1803366 [Multifurca ochricompacta]KAI0291179.1 hypothetical protein B0F90DRAFT_1779187 [Multifurca ochricompacta]
MAAAATTLHRVGGPGQNGPDSFLSYLNLRRSTCITHAPSGWLSSSPGCQKCPGN